MIQTHPDGHDVDYLRARQGIWSWLFTVDHKRLGVMYLFAILFFFFVGGVSALVLRTELLTNTHTIIDAKTYNKFFTVHGGIMVFLVIIPSIPAALGNFVLPLQLGAKDVAFPRLNLLSFWIYVVGSLMAVTAIFAGGIDTGWTFYTPYSSTTDGSVVMMAAAVFVLGFSSIFTGLNFIVTVHKMRPPGMTWFHMPLFLWGIYATAIIQVMATPILAITVLLLIMERVIKVGIFDPALGGDPVLFQHFFWFYSHPAVYIMILPGMAIISDLIAAFTRKRVFGYRFVAFSSLAIALISFVVWGHHMFVSGQSELSSMVFSFLTFLVAVPSGVKVFNWIATLHQGAISWKTPMVYALSFILLFTIGGLTGIFLGTLSVNVHLHDTYFIVAHFHYVMMGGTLIAFFGGLYYWWPKITGKMYNEHLGRVAAVVIFVGFNMTFFTQFILGARGMPRRYYNYLLEFEGLHRFSTVGAWVLAIGLLLSAICLLHSLVKGPTAPPNPWGARTLEWTKTSSPPIEHNFHETPRAPLSAYDYD
ncbi:MAG: cytochrome c oxidase subunit I [Deltaproteobacteria bacterium]|nr:cytochrome c oxidase subunit I [Deltaproteobacteria bacterium]